MLHALAHARPATRWEMHWLGRCLDNASMSKDPNTQVGSTLVWEQVSFSDGWNGFPRGIKDTPERLNNPELKRRLVVCAERNAILNIPRIGGRSTLGSTLYFVATDETGERWGGPPCLNCCLAAIQAGISEIVSLPPRSRPSRWHAAMPECEALLTEAGVCYSIVTDWRG